MRSVAASVVLLSLLAGVSADLYFSEFKAEDFETTLNKPALLSKTIKEAEGDIAVADGTLSLTQALRSSTTAVWYTNRQYLIDGFVADFDFQIEGAVKETDPELIAKNGKYKGGDGFAFVIQDNGLENGLGAAGAGLGYDGIPHSIAFEFDMYKDPDYSDPDDDHVAIHTRNAEPNSAKEDYGGPGRIRSLRGAEGGIEMKDGRVYNAVIKYGNKNEATGEVLTNGYHMTVEIAAREDLDAGITKHLRAIYTPISLLDVLSLPTGYAYVGFTAATGRAFQAHNIKRWDLKGEPKVTELLPPCGPDGGGTNVTVIGHNFHENTKFECVFGTIAVPAFQVSEGELYCQTPSVVRTALEADELVAKRDFFLRTLGRTIPSGISYTYYINPTFSDILPHGGPLSGDTVVTLLGRGFISELIGHTTVRLGNEFYKPVFVDQEAISITTNKQTATAHFPATLGVALNGQQYVEQTAGYPYHFYESPRAWHLRPRGGDRRGGQVVKVVGEFTTTLEMACKFGKQVVAAEIPELEAKDLYKKTGRIACIAPNRDGHPNDEAAFQVSLNTQQFVATDLEFTFDLGVSIWLIAGVTGLIATLMVPCFLQCVNIAWQFRDYRLVASKEYRQMTGHGTLESMMDLVHNRHHEDREKMQQVVSMLKVKKKASKISKGGKTWSTVAGAEGGSGKKGWDLLMNDALGDGEKKSWGDQAPPTGDDQL